MGLDIESGIPIPSSGGQRNRPGLTSTLRALQVGDSFVVPKERRAALSVAMMRERLRNGTEFTSRLIDDGRVRTWRTK